MNLFCTSKVPILGLRHFVIIDQIMEEGDIYKVLVSVLNEEVNFKVSLDHFENSGNWEYGWKELKKSDTVMKKNLKIRCDIELGKTKEVFLSEKSPFNIS